MVLPGFCDDGRLPLQVGNLTDQLQALGYDPSDGHLIAVIVCYEVTLLGALGVILYKVDDSEVLTSVLDPEIREFSSGEGSFEAQPLVSFGRVLLRFAHHRADSHKQFKTSTDI